MTVNLNHSNTIKSLNSTMKKSYFEEDTTGKKLDRNKISTSQISTSSLFDSAPEKYTLSKLINSVSNYRKESGSDFKIDVSSIKPSRLFHVDSTKYLGNPSNYSSILHKDSFISRSRKIISPVKNDTKISAKSDIETKEVKNEKKSIIDYFPVDKLIKIETKTIILMSKIKNPEQLREEYITWLTDFKESPFYEFQFHFKNVFDNESPIKESVSNLIKNSSNLLILSCIMCFWIADKNITNFDLSNNSNNLSENIDMKNIYDLMINNHRLYLLLCLFILIESELINNNENVYVLRLIEQIKAYLAKTLRNFNNRMLIINEIKTVTKKQVNIINKIMEQNSYYSQELLDYANNVNKIDTIRLFEIFEMIKSRNYLNNNLYKSRNDNKYIQLNDNNQADNNNNNNTNVNARGSGRMNFYKKKAKVNEHKNFKLTTGLYVKKTVGNRQPINNNNKVTNKIINIIINNNNNNSDINYDGNKSQLYINYNINQNNKNTSFGESYISRNNFDNNYIEDTHNYNNESSITINFNDNDNVNKRIFDKANKYKIINKNIPKYKRSGYNTSISRQPNNFYNYKLNSNTLNANSNYNINNAFYENSISFASKQFPQPEPPFLPPKKKSDFTQKNYTLILDLDETLVRYEINETNPDEANVILRPGLFYFLNKVYPLFDLVIWTVATKEYADPIIDIIEEKKKYFVARLFREHATFKNNSYIKDLTNLGRDINSIIIIDDKEISFSLQKQNGILIKPFYGTYSEVKNDFVLYDLFTIITKIILDKSKDVRQGINKYQYEIKQKVTKNYTKFINNKVEENDYNTNLNNSYKYNFKKCNDSFNNNAINYKAINRCHSINDSSGYNNNILRK